MHLSEEPPTNATNVVTFAHTMAAFVQQRSGWMRTDNLLFPWGCDFEFQNSSAMYHNMDPVRVPLPDANLLLLRR
eukprot:COSAG04_NODE_623_length_11808_cov_2.965838_7_plen_75_part_00